MPPGLDIDRVGTYTGEVPRFGSIHETTIAKARLGAIRSDQDLALATEGV